MTITFEPLSYDGVLHVARNLREWDRKEIFACSWHDKPDELAKRCMQLHTFSWLVRDELPTCVIGGVPMWPNVWSMWMYATDDFPRVATSVSKFAKRVIIPKLWASKAHRLECYSLEGNPSQTWLEWLGFQRAGVMRNYGKNRETFLHYELVRN